MKLLAVFPLVGKALLPKTVKRTFFMVSVFLSLERSRGMDEPRLEELNERLSIMHDKSTLSKVADMARVYLKGCPVCAEDGVSKVAQEAVRWAPAWMDYGHQRMMRDVSRVFLCSLSRSKSPQ